jgi:plastocyanin
MYWRSRSWMFGVCAGAFVFLAFTIVQAASIKGRFTFADPAGRSKSQNDAGAVVWLVPAGGQAAQRRTSSAPARRITLLQKNKRFDPHVLVVEVGTLVDFPNRDPFFHNVFSLFDGKRFDLGLYEAGSTRSVHLDRPGVCYIFCNIHPEMSAVIVVVNSPYFAVSNASGEFEIPNVPAGRYRLNVWAEHCDPKTLATLSRELTIGDENALLGTIALERSRQVVTTHSNKYGKDYDPQVFSSPAYIQP